MVRGESSVLKGAEMKGKRGVLRIVLVAAGLALAILLVSVASHAKVQCEDNQNPEASPSPHGLVQKTTWNNASIYIDASLNAKNSQRVHYTYCHPAGLKIPPDRP
jgi:hypothetical protein